ncbi:MULTISPECIES: HAD hydrolase-like protein [Burkholderia]|uniref:Hydrolase n=1 Tax=Burkholderia savannae TaxID=1637837 RepID=A0ABR5T4A1_9BURK|nr:MULTISPECIES: HAD hydrolase-like protein [Burkholderia]AOJ71359.1 hydrolase [Burkholderia savannae]AOK49756.1 hydrolase [Burkholderia sp. MSMB617WGS]KGR95400.1 HAD hydrolase, IA, variant 1 family protein [Burkholderia sp. ABCPW 111]KVG49173.1 hydrolase [Burkholderia sp. MSMB0265]KVG81907.1 hydrolase [Burkholderia sp. MSMB2040]
MGYKLIAFDFDGTLADSLACFLHALSESARHHGFRAIDDALLPQVRGMSAREIVELLGVPQWKVPRIAADMRRRMQARAPDVRLFPGIDATLRALAQRGTRVAVATSNSEAVVRAIAGPATCAHIRHFSCGISLFGKARRLRLLARASGFARADVLYVGDEVRDAEAADNAGIAFRGVAWGYTAPQALRAHCGLPLIERPEELLAL